MDSRIKSAPPTSDGKPAPIGDPRYANPPSDDEHSNDRSWESDSDTATGGSQPVTDSEGNPTGEQSISLQFPVFCEWAFKMCEWYDNWKKTDVVAREHMKKTEEHQSQEKSFWQTVKDWFNWTKEQPDLEDKELEIEQESVIDYQYSDHVVFGQTCPFSDNNLSVDFGIGAWSFNYSFSIICDYAVIARPYVIAFGHLGALIFLLIGLRSGSV